MTQLRTQVDNNGRVLIPAQMRKELKIKPGDIFVMRVINSEIRMISLNKAVKEAQELVKQYVPEGTSLVDDLFQMRREEYRSEKAKLRRISKKHKEE